MYNDADLYVFDDVLSALDAHVGKQVFDQCVGELRTTGKTVLMSTNQLQYLPRSDQVIFVKHDVEKHEGWLNKVGTFANLMEDADFCKLMEEVGISEDDFVTTPKGGDAPSEAEPEAEAEPGASDSIYTDDEKKKNGLTEEVRLEQFSVV